MDDERVPRPRPSLDDRKVGDEFMYCPRDGCGFRMPPGSLAKPICPECGENLRIWVVEETDFYSFPWPEGQYELTLKDGTSLSYGNGTKCLLPKKVQAERASDGKWLLVSIAHEEIPAESVEKAEPLPRNLWCLG